VSRGRWSPPPPAAGEFKPWKPDRCEAPGCEERHPSFSRTGGKGPWLCRHHYHNPPSRKADQPSML
jgi:hypothetical protein